MFAGVNGSLSDSTLFTSGPLADPEERQVIFAALDSFRQYRKNCHYNVTHRRRQNLYALPSAHWQRLAAPPISLLDTLSKVDDAIDCNADIADEILEVGLRSLGLWDGRPLLADDMWFHTATSDDMAKAHSTLRQFYREWSTEGFEAEIKPLLEAVLADLRSFCLPITDNTHPSVLVPGAGLGRFLLELVLAGYNAEGNEISYHQLMASNFVLNSVSKAEQFMLYPFVNNFTNHCSRSRQLKGVPIPDVHPATMIRTGGHDVAQGQSSIGQMNMTAGDFITAYADADSHESFDAVATVYFVDTAPNLIRYIETVRHCLKSGGIWTNIGPLLWHFNDRDTESDLKQKEQQAGNTSSESKNEEKGIGIGAAGSFELTNEEVLLLVQQFGFEIVRQTQLAEQVGGYIQDTESMIQSRYRCSHWVVRKVSE